MSPAIALLWLRQALLAAFLGPAVSIGSADFRLVTVPGEVPSSLEVGDAIGYQVLVEQGLESEAADLVLSVARVLEDPRGWAAAGKKFVRVSERPRFRVLLAHPRTVDRLCLPLKTGRKYSCGRAGRAVLNARRWQRGTATWGDEIRGYRVYMINHEVGHLLGMPHRGCPEPGADAFVMAQQTISLQGCRPANLPDRLEIERLRTKWQDR